jgi:hypothetical protein
LFQLSSSLPLRCLSCLPRLPCLPCLLPADSFNRWEAGHVLAKKLMRALYASAAASNAGTPAERFAAEGGVKLSLVDAYRSLLNGAQNVNAVWLSPCIG